ncbi:MAG: uroporphyrinogen decarboxylase [Planctomycetales bacterium]
MDAAILFADLLPMLIPMGIDLEYAQGEGPVIHNPLRETKDLERFKALPSMEPLEFVLQAVRLIRRDLPRDIPLLGFAGAPFTLASYIIEGAGSRNYLRTKGWMYRDAGAWKRLMETLVESLILYINSQVDAGCQGIQLFDSWAGCLSPADYATYVMPYTKAVIAGIRPGVPVINFLTGNPALLPLNKQAGGDVIGLDWRVDLREAWDELGPDVGVQGNLDPVLLFADKETLRKRVQEVMTAARNQPGHIFNLGHGVLPETPVDNVLALVDMVHEMGAR